MMTATGGCFDCSVFVKTSDVRRGAYIPSNTVAVNNSMPQAAGSVKRELYIVTFSRPQPRWQIEASQFLQIHRTVDTVVNID